MITKDTFATKGSGYTSNNSEHALTCDDPLA